MASLEGFPVHVRRGGTMRAVGRNMGWLLASRGVLAVLSLFYYAMVTRALGVVGFGRFMLIWGAAQTLATLVAFQSWQIVVTYGVAPAQEGDDERLGRLFRASALLDLGSALVGSVLAAIILEIWSEQLGIGPTLKRAALILAIVNVVTIRSTPTGILRLKDRFSWAALCESVTPVTRLLGVATAYFVHPTVQGFMVAWGVAEVMTAGAYWIMAGRLGTFRLIRQGRGGMRQLLDENPGLVRFAISSNFNSTLAMSGKQVPLLVVGAALGPAAAGSFRLASQIAQSLAKLSQMLSRAAFPEVVRAVRHVSTGAMRAIVAKMMGVTLLTGCAILGLIAVFGRQVLDLIGGQHFPHSYGVLMWMAAAGCIDLATLVLETTLTARSRAGTVFLVRIGGTVTIFALAWPLVTRFGPTGMAVAVFAGSLIVTLVMGTVTWTAGRPRADRAIPPLQPEP